MVTTRSGRYKVTATTTRAAAVFVMLSALLSACRAGPSTPRGTAERFLDAHYVRIDLPAALPYTKDLARHKVEEEIGLTQGQAIDESTRKPSVHYTFLEEHPVGDDLVNYLYRGTIVVEDADRFERRWLVTVRRDDVGWRVTNYQELGE